MVGKRQMEWQSDQATILSWNIANFSRAQKLPDLAAVLARASRGRRPQTPEEQFQIMQRLSAELGVPIRKVKRSGG